MRPEPGQLLFFSKSAPKAYWEMPALERLFLVFGSETKGLPPSLLAANADMVYRIPIENQIRCLNLSTAVGIALFESLRMKFVT
jgi:tRNA (cytidine/uridine-2'-O-)-methyltransferase